jgi:CRISPR system Cascade subunit CasC
MKLIELHILQSFPVTCLNRDDLGSPKSAVFGGATRARISSQSLKRAIRETAAGLNPKSFKGERTRLIIEPVIERLKFAGVDEKRAVDAAKAVGDALATFDKKAEKDGKLKVKTLMFLSPAELDAISDAVVAGIGEGKKDKELIKEATKAIKSVSLKDAADIALFGRFVASEGSLTVEGAGLFSHALSTHKADNEVDFFSAVDDAQSADESGAGMTGTLEFNSATYYRYAAVNLDMLDENLPTVDADEKKSILDAFIRANLTAVPGARKNSMNGATLPVFVSGIVKEGQPLQLVNAFESPVASKKGIVEESVERLKAHREQLKATWNLTHSAEVDLPDVDLNKFCKTLLDAAL